MSRVLQVQCFVAGVAVYMLKTLFTRLISNLPPGPTSLPVIGSLHLIGKSPHQSLARMAQQYGPLMSLRLGQKLCVVATSPQAAMEFLKTQDTNFQRRPPLRAAEVIWPEDIVFNDITPSSRHAKKIFQTMLTSAKRLEECHHARADEISYMLRGIPKDGTIVLRQHLEVMIANIMTHMTLSKSSMGKNSIESTDGGNLEEAKEFTEITEELTEVFGAFNLQDFIPAFKWLDLQGLEARMKKVRNRMETYISKVIEEHLELRNKNITEETNSRQGDMLDALLDGIDDDRKLGHGISMDMLKGTIWNVFAAGTETTATAIEWILAEVCRNPKVLQKAHAELDAVVGQTRRVLESDIPKLKYLQAIVKEAFRLHPPVPLLLPHYAIEPCKVLGYNVPANTRLLVNMWAIGRDAKIWTDPLEFIPERFLDGGSHAGIEIQGQNFELLPFGSGRRSCPGIALGALVVHTVIANLLHAFSWERLEEINMSEGVGLAVPMAVPLTAHAKARSPFHLYQ